MPPRYLIIDGGQDDGSNEGMDYVDYLLEQEYNATPSTLIDYPETPEEAGDRAYYDSMGASLPENPDVQAQIAEARANGTLGKLVV